MSRKYREWKKYNKLAHENGMSLAFKSTLSSYKSIKRKIQKNYKNLKNPIGEDRRRSEKIGEELSLSHN